MMPITVVYKPEVSTRKFCPETGKPVPPSTTHWLETGDGKHLGIVNNSNLFDPAAVARLFETAPELLTLVKDCKRYLESVEEGLPPGAPMPEQFEAAIAKAEGRK